MAESATITEYLNQLDPNDPESYDQLWRMMYDELHALAHRELYKWKPGQTLNTTALVHECFLKLRAAEKIEVQNRAHFYRLARTAMRQLVIDFARARSRQKHGGRVRPISLQDATIAIPDEGDAEELLAIDDALERYGQMGDIGERGKKIVEYVYFVGLTHKETAELLGSSTKLVQRSFKHFKAWYKRDYARI